MQQRLNASRWNLHDSSQRDPAKITCASCHRVLPAEQIQQPEGLDYVLSLCPTCHADWLNQRNSASRAADSRH